MIVSTKNNRVENILFFMVSLHDKVISICTSKTKTVLILLICVSFVVIGIWILRLPHVAIFESIFATIIGFTSVSFFSLCGFYCVTRLFDNRPRLILDSTGIIDRSSAISAGRILWQDIRRIDVTQVGSQRFLTFYVTNPRRYLQRGGFFERQMKALNYKFYGSPIHISTSSLQISFGEFSNLVFEYYDRYSSNDFN